MAEVVVVGAFTAVDGKQAEAEDTMRALIEPTHDEDGCILYALHRGADDPNRLTFIERWSSREALDAHLSASHIQDVLERIQELFGDSGEITVYEPLPAGETRKGSLADHAAG